MWSRITTCCCLLAIASGQNVKTNPLTFSCETPIKSGSCTIRSLKIQLNDVFTPSKQAPISAKTVTIEGSKVEFLPQELLDRFPQLETFNAVEVGLKKLAPASFAKSLQLKRLDVSTNSIDSLPTNVYGSCLSLEELNVAKNKLHLFGGIELIGCGKLRYLNVSSNQLIDLSWDALRDLRALQIVDLSHNLIPSLTVPKYPKTIYTSNNHIHTLEVDDGSFIFALEQLHLSKNRLRNIEVLARFAKMTHIDLSYNRLLSVDFALFKNMRSLRELNMAFNNIFTITTSDLKPLTLSVVDLSHNELTNLRAADSAGIGSAETLLLEGNYLVSFELTNGVENFQRLRSISLDGNDWMCKDLEDVLTKLKSKKVTIKPGQQTCGPNQILKHGFCCRDLGVSFEEVVLLKSQKLAEMQQSNTVISTVVTSTVKPSQSSSPDKSSPIATKQPSTTDNTCIEKIQNKIALLESQVAILTDENRSLKASLFKTQTELKATNEKLNRCKSSTNQRTGQTVLID